MVDRDEWDSLSGLEKRTVLIEAKLKRLETTNRGLLMVLEFIRDRLEPRPRDAGEISPLEDAAYQCYEVTDAAIKWVEKTEPPPEE